MDLESKAKQLRATCIKMAHDAGEGHLSSALSCLDILNILYHEYLDYDAGKNRDRFYFSKGHAAAALYAVLADVGLIDKSELSTYGKSGTNLGNHPCRHVLPVLEMSSGSLGHGLGIATGAMYGMRVDGLKGRCVVLMSDGECNEGSVWESAMFAKAQSMDRLLAIVDNNGVQAVGRNAEIMGHTSLEEKFKAHGWTAVTVDGHSYPELQAALSAFPMKQGRPHAIIAKTVAGKGVSFMEDDQVWHYRKPSDEDLENALRELGVRPVI